MPDESPPVPLQVFQLAYADLAHQYGVILETEPGNVRITIPPSFFKFFLPPVVVELDATQLRFQGVVDEWEKTNPMVRPRDAIYEVKFVPHSGKLFVKSHGHDFLECQPHRDPKVVEWIADQLNEALGFAHR